MLLEFNVVIVYVRTSQIHLFQQARAFLYGYTPEQHFCSNPIHASPLAQEPFQVL
jgi:hypothetical protein